MLEPDYARLEQTFKDYVGSLPNYKRSAIFEYINALKAKIKKQADEIDELGTELAKR